MEFIALWAKAETVQPSNLTSAIPHVSPVCAVCGLCSRSCACDEETFILEVSLQTVALKCDFLPYLR